MVLFTKANIDDDKLKSVQEYLNQMAHHRSEAGSDESCKEEHSTPREPRYKKV